MPQIKTMVADYVKTIQRLQELRDTCKETPISVCSVDLQAIAECADPHSHMEGSSLLT